MNLKHLALIGIGLVVVSKLSSGLSPMGNTGNATTQPDTPLSPSIPSYTTEYIQGQINQLNLSWKQDRSPIESALKYLEGQMRAGNQNLVPEYRAWQTKGRELSYAYQGQINEWRALL